MANPNWVKGVSGNPGGRPKGGLTEVLRARLKHKGEDGRRNDVAIAETLITMARDGDMEAIREVWDRVDGKVPQKTEHTGNDGGPLRVESYDYHLAITRVAPRSVVDSLAPGEAKVLPDGAALGQDGDGR